MLLGVGATFTLNVSLSKDVWFASIETVLKVSVNLFGWYSSGLFTSTPEAVEPSGFIQSNVPKTSLISISMLVLAFTVGAFALAMSVLRPQVTHNFKLDNFFVCKIAEMSYSLSRSVAKSATKV